jgi:hypothetical protein
VRLQRSAGRVDLVEVTVGGAARASASDLGNVTPQEAVGYLLELASTGTRWVGKRAMLAATLANAPEQITTGLIELTRRTALNIDVKKEATFWLGQTNDPRGTARLKTMLEDDDENIEVRKSTIFALSRQDNADVIQTLLNTAQRADRKELRKDAIFWLGQKAADKATVGLKSILGDDSAEIEVREAAIFALTQQRNDAAVVALIDVAKSSKEPQLRRTALFWLGQRSEDPRVLKLFQDILLKN